ncbi:hypothetical protein [Actinokineospora sp. NBRC 105648]|uniref:hypothetical protein n=1 Tax=Actinokineospora sp. NBRC 105648 TaxID=3032206 RepID=UPI00255583A3|nr:hypothetical protein [Actinokineospora sp. NBRC 105648]
MDRRDLLKLLGVAAVPPWLDSPNTDDHERLARAVLAPQRVDAQVIDHIDALVFDAYVADTRFGPEIALATVRAQSDLLHAMVDSCPQTLRPRLLSVLGNAVRICGWLSFNAGDKPSAASYYERARRLAHQAGDPDLAAFTLADHAILAIWAKQPRTAVDHSLAADYWVARGGNPTLKAFVSDMTAVSHAAAGNGSDALRQFDATGKHLDDLPNATPVPYYNYSHAIHTARRGQALLSLGRTSEAVPIITNSLAMYKTLERTDKTQVGTARNLLISELELSKARAIEGEVEEAVRIITDATPRITQLPTPRMGERLQDILDHLQPWADTPAIRELTNGLRHQKLIAR